MMYTNSPRISHLAGLLLLLGGIFVDVVKVDGQTANSGSDAGVEVANLKEQLTFGLRAQLPSEHAFIALVVKRVETGKLPLDTVMSTFAWARRKRPHPFPYFEHALRLRAARKDIPL